ncbi:MAG: beta family protein [Alkaliphilus sp.]
MDFDETLSGFAQVVINESGDYMYYVPILKNRQQELKLVRDYNACFSEKIIPMIEIIAEKTSTKILEGKTEDGLEVIKDLIERLNGKEAFIDFFTFDERVYKRFTPDKCRLAIDLRGNSNLYYSRLDGVSNFGNLVPVLSIKKARNFKDEKLEVILRSLKNKNDKIAVRITSDYIYEYIETISKILDKDDFFMFDIREENLESKLMELTEIADSDISSKKIILNSPRRQSINNATYEESDWTTLIDNAVAIEYIENRFDGFGDFMGLKDTLPSGGGSGKGAALALIYSYKENKFYSVVNKNTGEGVKGYKEVIRTISMLDQDEFEINKCDMFVKIKEMKTEGRSGSWATWKYLTMVRYLDQVYRHK